MAIDFDKAKKNIGKSYDKAMGAWEKEHQKQLKAQQEAEKQAKLEKLKKAKKTTKTPNGHTVNAGGRKQLTPEAKLELERQQATNAVPKFLRNMTEAVIDNSVLGGITTLAYGKKPSSDFDSPYYDEIHSGTSATLGRLTGQGAMFASQFAAGSAPLDKVSQAVAKTKLGQAVAKSVIGDATIGLGQNIVMAKGEGLEGEDLVKDVALNTGLDLALGAGLEVVPAAKNYLKNTKLAKQAKNVGEVVDTTKKVAETGDLGAKTTIINNAPRKTQLKNASQKASFTKDLNKEFERAYNEDHQKLADYIREYKGKGSTTHIVPINEDATGRGLRYTVSNNDDWYRKALKKYGSNNAVNKNADEIAADILNEELRLKRGQQEYASEYLYDLGELKQRNQLEMPTGKVKANGVPIKHKKVGGFDVESSNIGAVNPDILFVGDKIENAKGLFDKLYKYTVSGQKELERLSKVAGNTKVDDYTQAVRTAKGVVSNIFHSSLVDSAGKVINKKSYKTLIDEIPKNVRKDFQTYAEKIQNIDRVREGVPVYKHYST